MTAYDFSLVKNTSFAFNGTTDSLNLGSVSASALGVSTDTSGNLVLTIGTDSVTLQGASASQVTASNFTFGTATDRSAWVVGDNNTGTTFDASGNTINLTNASLTGVVATQANANHLVYGLGGGDAITVGNGNNVIFGGSGVADSTDGNDTITVGTGGNTIYANAGNDSVDADGAATASGTTNTIYLGLGDDTLDADDGGGIINAGNFVVYGNSGADSIHAGSDTSGDVTIFGGNGAADSTDGSDRILTGTGNVTAYGNQGDDTFTGGQTGANKVYNVFAGLGNDSITSADGNNAATAVLYGNTGNDVIANIAWTGDATIFGGNAIADSTDGNDTITLGEGSSLVYANAGNDTISLTGGLLNSETVIIHTGSGNDIVNVTSAQSTGAANTGDLADITLYSNDGNDTFNLNNAGTAAVEYDYAFLDFAAGDVINATLDGAGAATALTVSGGGSSLTLQDVNGSFVFQGYAGDLNATSFNLGAGKGDLITNFSGTAATLTGTAGEADQLISGTSGDTLNGGETAAGVADKLVGGAGDDTFILDDAQVTGRDTNGVLTNVEQDDTLEGGSGTDTLQITGSTAVTIAADDLNAVTGVGGPFNWSSIEIFKFADVTGHNVTLSDTNQATLGLTTLDFGALTTTKAVTLIDDNSDFAANLTIVGNTATGGMTVIRDTGTDHNDNFSFSSGADSLTTLSSVFTANDTIAGGAGTDSVTFSDGAAFGSILDAVWANKTALETVILSDSGGAVAKSLTLGANAQAAGVVTVNGSALLAGDTLSVNASAYTTALAVTGGADADTLTGGSGADRIEGGLGMDLITGGTGADTIVLSAGAFAAGNASADTIVGFVNGTDIFDFTANLVNGTTGPTSVLTVAATNIVTVADNGLATANDVVFAFTGANDQMAAGSTAANAVANAVTALTSTADFSSANVAANDSLLLLLDDGTNSFIFHYFAGGTVGTTEAADLQLLAIVNGVADVALFQNADFI